MKIDQNNTKLKLSGIQLSKIEKDLGVFLVLDISANTDRPCQSFRVLDKDKKYVGHVISNGAHFSEKELKEEIKKLF